MRFATRALLLQLTTVVAVVALCTAVFLYLSVEQLRAESEASALNIARTVAEDPDVRDLVTAYSADPGTPSSSQLRDGALQQLATAVAARTDALFVVIADDHGIRLAHPNQDLLGQVVSTPFQEVLEGNEVVDWETGTLGESARAKVPVFPVGGGDPVGEVSVGFERASVFDDLPALLGTIALAAAGGIGLAVLASFLMRQRWEKLTLGLQPEELVALVQNQEAVLDGVGDGVIALDTHGVVRVCNEAASRMLGITDPVGQTLAGLGVPDQVIEDTATGAARAGVVLGDRVLYLDSHTVVRDGRELGDVVIVRDRTDVVALSERLESVRAMSSALRVQRHEFANRMHVAVGLLDAERPDQARAFLADLVDRGDTDSSVTGLEVTDDPFVRSFLSAKGLEARERGVRLLVGQDTQLMGELAHVEDVAAVLGNLIDNAVTAAVAGDEPRWVEVTMLTDAEELVVTVADSGSGIPDGTDVFARRSDQDGSGPEPAHGHGIGLPLSRELARRSGGDLWVLQPGGSGLGAVFGARLPGVIRPAGAKENTT